MVSDSDSFDYKSVLRQLPTSPGVYKMRGPDGGLLYVGKASSLKTRVASYFRGHKLTAKNAALVEKIAKIEVVTTASESEALLLEQNIIKAERPPYNVLLRDDKSYPYICLSQNEDFPRLSFERGKRKKSASYFGPYPNSYAARAALNLLQKAFRVRQCEDSYFRNRSRPCLQYQIKRCKAPCVNYVSADEYARDVACSKRFLQGESGSLIEHLQEKMDRASGSLEYELAAQIRDQIQLLRKVQSEQVISTSHGCADVMAAAQEGSSWCVMVLFIRSGQMRGSQAYYPRSAPGEEKTGLMSGFLAQFYLRFAGLRDFPEEIIIPYPIEDASLLAKTISDQAGHCVVFRQNVRGDRRRWLEMAAENAKLSLRGWLAGKQSTLKRFQQLRKLLNLSEIPERIECFDVSHLHGEGTVASCVVFDQNGPLKKDYRRYNITDITAGDDYAAMEQAVERRFAASAQGAKPVPDVLLIDGGMGQLNIVVKVMDKKSLQHIPVYGLAKGPARKVQLELLLNGRTGKCVSVDSHDDGLQLLQQVRDEAHRFALAGNRRSQRGKRQRSVLEGLPGIGAVRRSSLLRHFGGMQALQSAGVSDIAKVPGISHSLAQNVWSFLHNRS